MIAGAGAVPPPGQRGPFGRLRARMSRTCGEEKIPPEAGPRAGHEQAAVSVDSREDEAATR
ncbi:hypothetical protein HD597_003540 [Nonomuraea thailandensis]|uniref:Uncharacterized protein n=1 Tax=Nonomuraea thailandensis TaxID=1188745 RepID=A0A9X2GEX7_9ACTN|nr:hypothetical protein [Nonomuraea thailandensis]MCP2356520.1 hypothetical protein [Nonomuraea thailandensis]